MPYGWTVERCSKMNDICRDKNAKRFAKELIIFLDGLT